MFLDRWLGRGLGPPSDGRIRLGERGEALAARELERRGYRIVARRWRCRLGEIDLVARDAEVLVFIEVKTRRGGGASGLKPQDSVGYRKRRKLVQLAKAYLAAKRLREPDLAVRFDVVAVGLPERGPVTFELVRDAFGEDG